MPGPRGCGGRGPDVTDTADAGVNGCGRDRTRQTQRMRDINGCGRCRMRGPAGGWPEQTAGGLRGAKPPGLGVRGLSPG